MSVFSFHTFLFSETEHRNNVNPSLFIQMTKVEQQNGLKKKPGASKYVP